MDVIAPRMGVRPLGPLRTGSLLFRAESGAWTLAVVAKATFVLAPGVSPLVRGDGDDVTTTDIPWDDDVESSLRYASDLVPFKRSPEVLITGSAYAPEGVPVRSLLTRVAVAGVDKQIEVWGDCHFDRQGHLSAPAPFMRMPLRWERAAGGPGTANPVGVPTGAHVAAGARGPIAVPNLRSPARGAPRLHDTAEIVGLGPLSPSWEPRRARLQGHAEMWDLYHFTDRPLPEDLDAGYFNAAPEDQLLPKLSPGEVIVLEHLHPEHPRLSTRLERVVPAAELELPSGRRVEVPMLCDTLCIVPDRGIATLTFRGHVTLVDPGQPGMVVIGLEEALAGPSSAASPAWSPPLALSEEEPSLSEYMELTLAEEAEEEPIETTLPGPVAAGHADPLPFVRPVAFAPPIVGLPGAPATAIAGLPGAAWPPPGANATLAQMLHARVQEQPRRAPSPVPPAPVPVEAPGPVSVEAPGPVSIEAPGSVSVEAAQVPVPVEAPGPVSVEAPGPVSVDAAPEPREEPALPLERAPITRCAAITASIDRRPDALEVVLREEGLDVATWERLAAHWDAAIRRELRRSKNDLLRAHDTAYVERLESERGPITAFDYARLAVAAQVSEPSAVLRELDLPEPSWPKIRRVWIARMAKDLKLARIVRDLMDQQ